MPLTGMILLFVFLEQKIGHAKLTHDIEMARKSVSEAVFTEVSALMLLVKRNLH